MDITKTAQETARRIRECIKSGEIPAVAHTDRGEDLTPTQEEMWKEIEGRWANIIARELEVAHEAGRQEGLTEARQKR
jgi:hypothetical protein